MQALVVILNKTEYLDEVLQVFATTGIRGATIFDSVGMGRTLAANPQSAPVIASIRRIANGIKPHNKTIISVIDREEDALLAMQKIEDILGDMSRPGTGIMFTVPLGHVVGLAPHPLHKLPKGEGEES